jgi:hypothetical protein
VWVWTPYDCYYHLYSKQDLLHCSAQCGIKHIHTIGDSQEREFVSMMKQINGSEIAKTKYEWVSSRENILQDVVRVVCKL